MVLFSNLISKSAVADLEKVFISVNLSLPMVFIEPYGISNIMDKAFEKNSHTAYPLIQL